MTKVPHLLDDPYLEPFQEQILARQTQLKRTLKNITDGTAKTLEDFASAHEFFGLHKTETEWIFREWAPNAVEIYLVGDFSEWKKSTKFALRRLPSPSGIWEGHFPLDSIKHNDRYHLAMSWPRGGGERIPAYARYVVQDKESNLFEAVVWDPQGKYQWKCNFSVPKNRKPIIYEAHVGMSGEEPKVTSYSEFRSTVLPRIVKAGYNTLQLMAVMEHPYYGSFGYHVGSFYASSSRFGTPDELKALIDDAHTAGLAVIMDLVHSHAVRNERDGLSCFDGTENLYFHSGGRGWHSAWNSRVFDYGKTEVMHFLLSNCRYYLDEFRFDGFRFDGVTSMLYTHHGLGTTFCGYSSYFDLSVDHDALTYLTLANKLIHTIRPDAITIAEDVSGMPGIAAPITDGGIGFDYRLAMGNPDMWFKYIRDIRDDDWDVGHIYYELTNKRAEEKVVSYVESHDQALVGGKSFIFEMMDSAIYDSMHVGVQNPITDRAIALHKMARLVTLALSGGAYLNFMGNEFGHPEWIDFPREGNGNSYSHARRQWSLRDNENLLFKALGDFDEDMQKFISSKKILSASPRLLVQDNEKKVLAFERNGYIFAFNFHPTASYPDFHLLVPPGRYRGIFNTDSKAYGGQNRIAEKQKYPVTNDIIGNECVKHAHIYLPSRTALVLKQSSSGLLGLFS